MLPPGRDATFGLPRILCLHGGGVNAYVFRLQCRAIIRRLTGYFRLVFVEGPFICDAHPDIVSVYGGYGPFRRWLPAHQPVDAKTAADQIRLQLHNTMLEDNASGATGEWVGLMGFSQGAGVCASLLYTQQLVRDVLGAKGSAPNWRFAVLFAGRGPLVALDSGLPAPWVVGNSGETSVEFGNGLKGVGTTHVLKLPTIHVHGIKDPGLQHHRRLLETCCHPETTRLIEWDGAHRMPIKTDDVDVIARAIIQLGQELGLTDMIQDKGQAHLVVVGRVSSFREVIRCPN